MKSSLNITYSFDMLLSTPTISFLPDNGEMSALIKDHDWSQTSVGSPDQWPQSLRTTLSILLNSRFPTVLFWGPDLVCFYNDAFRPSLGIDGKHPWSLGREGKEMWAEIWPVIKPWIDQVLAGGESIWMENQLVPFYRNGQIEDIYWTFCYNAVFDESGKPGGVLVTCTETTQTVLRDNHVQEQLIAKRKIEESERNFRNLVLQAPVGICIVQKGSTNVETINDVFLKIVGRSREQMENRPYWETLQEAASAYAPIMQNVFDTGNRYSGVEHRIDLTIKGVRVPIYVTFVYEPVKNEDGEIDKLMVLAIDVTSQVQSRLLVENTRVREKLAIEVSQLGIFDVDLITNEVIASPRLAEIFGLDVTTDRNAFVSVIHPEDLPLRQAAHAAALVTGSLRYEGRIVMKDGTIRWMRSWGTVVRDGNGVPLKLIGVTEDITDEKASEQELNKKVAARTTELLEKNMQLEQSNQKLEEFAHAASHDLKEPIRKMQYFIDKLKEQLGNRLNVGEVHTFERMEASAARMVSLVDDLLKYSHLNETPLEKEEVDLNKKIGFVLEDLELDIHTKKATIKLDTLPVVLGYRRQLQQLFQNLIGNALKYSRENVDPCISVRSKLITAKTFPTLFPENDISSYHLIEVEDNGIGFEQQYADQLFKIFYRLHNRSDFKGNGIGLAIAKKVIDNHQGKIIAEGKLNEGATFKVFLPVHTS